MRGLTVALDGVCRLREEGGSREIDLAAAALLAELAGVDAVRLGVCDELHPVREEDVLAARRAARRLELRMAPAQGLIKIALEARPDRVVLAGEGSERRPLDLRGPGTPLEPAVRALAEAGIASAALVPPDLEAVKRAHGAGVPAVEFHTSAVVDLPPRERRAELERLGDAVRLAAKLHLGVGIGGGLGYRELPEALEAAPAVDWVVVGRAALARALLVGMDRALRDLRALVA